jgi:argininosuccinate lyase
MKKPKQLWEKAATKLHPAVHQYIIDPNLEADKALLKFDIRASIAHAEMLESVALLEKKDLEVIRTTLQAIEKDFDAGVFVLDPALEDVHTAIENALVERVGDLGKRIHVGRSRNDQVLVAMRLYTKEALVEIDHLLLESSKTILEFARTHEDIPMPGYTHMQKAMPSSVGQWAASFVEAMINDRDLIETARKLNDQNPLGSAAGFGTGLPLDRNFTTQKLGFSKTQINPLFSQMSRSKFESFTLSTLVQVMLSLDKVANDLIIFTNQEFNFFQVDACLTTGSSIMPQKRNLDIMEVLRANTSIVLSLQNQVQTVGLNLLSGYNKDLKITKKALMEGIKIVKASLSITALTFKNLRPNKEALMAACSDPTLYAADAANSRVMSGETFRDAYRFVGENLDTLKPEDPKQNLLSKTHLGSTGNLGLDDLEKRLGV